LAFKVLDFGSRSRFGLDNSFTDLIGIKGSGFTFLGTKIVGSFGSKSFIIIGLTGVGDTVSTTYGKDGSLSVAISIQGFVWCGECGGAIGG